MAEEVAVEQDGLQKLQQLPERVRRQADATSAELREVSAIEAQVSSSLQDHEIEE